MVEFGKKTAPPEREAPVGSRQRVRGSKDSQKKRRPFRATLESLPPGRLDDSHVAVDPHQGTDLRHREYEDARRGG